MLRRINKITFHYVVMHGLRIKCKLRVIDVTQKQMEYLKRNGESIFFFSNYTNAQLGTQFKHHVRKRLTKKLLTPSCLVNNFGNNFSQVSSPNNVIFRPILKNWSAIRKKKASQGHLYAELIIMQLKSQDRTTLTQKVVIQKSLCIEVECYIQQSTNSTRNHSLLYKYQSEPKTQQLQDSSNEIKQHKMIPVTVKRGLGHAAMRAGQPIFC